MSNVILDDNLRAKLNGLNEELEIRDESGKLVGHFVPADFYRTILYGWAKWEFSQDEEDIKRAREEMKTEGGYTTAEVLARIKEVELEYQKKKGGQ